MNAYKEFIRANSEYLSRADEDALSIHYDITLGCWVYFDPESTNVATGIISKWYETGIERSYVLYKDASNRFVFKVSDDGTGEYSVTDLGANYQESTWFFIAARFTPSSELALFVNGMWYSNINSIPATIFNDAEAFELGRYNHDNYLDGRIAQVFVCAYTVPDHFICLLYSHSRAMFLNQYQFARPCSSSSTSSTSSSSSSSTSSSSSSAAP